MHEQYLNFEKLNLPEKPCNTSELHDLFNNYKHVTRVTIWEHERKTMQLDFNFVIQRGDTQTLARRTDEGQFPKPEHRSLRNR
jgi:hypothetical protein